LLSGRNNASVTTPAPLPAEGRSASYVHLEALLAAERCVILDGGIATELQRARPLRGGREPDQDLWGTWALDRAPEAVLDVHRSYVAAGCDVISTNTWSIASALEGQSGPRELARWLELARLGVDLARRAIAEAGREGECAVAFAIAEDIDAPERSRTAELLARLFADDPPDLVLLETLTLVRDPGTFELVERVLETGVPVWLSFRRCRHGVCGVFGQHWGPPEGDLFGHAARRFEELGVGALLVNCLPVDHVPGMLSWLRDFTTLPLGVYPNLGHLAGPLWRFDDEIGPEEYAELARSWRAEGAQIVGGCCGTTPAHLEAAARALADTRPGTERPAPTASVMDEEAPEVAVRPWLDDRGRPLFPLPFPELVVDPGVFVPTQGSFLVWKHLFRTGIGEGARCVDVGCGTGILAIQLALNGAASVHAIDIDRRAVENTLANARRNGVGDRVTGDTADLFDWTPRETFDVVVASLYQLPVDPFSEATGHRPLDYWGRTVLDHFLRLLPDLLAERGTAYVMQLSVIGQAATERLVAAAGLQARVADFSFFPFGPLFVASADQIARVEELSDAYHIEVGGEHVMVAYLLEVTRTKSA
jgi:S-methylmethionine-dependent homocysteine/selenocysteine methylase/SAM-dependent methyltransferase